MPIAQMNGRPRTLQRLRGMLAPAERFVLMDIGARGGVSDPLTAGRFIRRRRYLELGGHSTECVFGDYDFLIRLCLCKVKSKVRCELSYTYRAHPLSTTFAGRPETIMLMMRENMRLAARYLGSVQGRDRRALLRLHAGSALRLFFMNLRRGKRGEAAGALAEAYRTDSSWPLAAASWYAGSALSRLRHYAGR